MKKYSKKKNDKIFDIVANEILLSQIFNKAHPNNCFYLNSVFESENSYNLVYQDSSNFKWIMDCLEDEKDKNGEIDSYFYLLIFELILEVISNA